MKKTIFGYILGLLSIILPIRSFCKKHRDFVVRSARLVLLEALDAQEKPKCRSYVDYSQLKKVHRADMEAKTVGGL